jgi:hypothetical protein
MVTDRDVRAPLGQLAIVGSPGLGRDPIEGAVRAASSTLKLIRPGAAGPSVTVNNPRFLIHCIFRRSMNYCGLG